MNHISEDLKFEVVKGGKGYFKNGTVLQVVGISNQEVYFAKVLKSKKLSLTVRGNLPMNVIQLGIANGMLTTVE